jgi:PTH2 family peptidyl-tRNA hydrolase
MSVKQVIVMRKDLNMRRGKQIAQGCHASLKVFFDRIVRKEHVPEDSLQRKVNPNNIFYNTMIVTDEMQKWIDGVFKKICVSVDSEQELIDCYNKAKEAGLPCSMIEDHGLTEFNGVITKTCIAIGPAREEDIDKITGGLKLL